MISLTKKLIAKEIITQEESRSLRSDDLVTSLHDIYLKRYGLERWGRRMMTFITEESEKQAIDLIQILGNYDIIPDETAQYLLAEFEIPIREGNERKRKVFDSFSVLVYLFELEQSKLPLKK